MTLVRDGSAPAPDFSAVERALEQHVEQGSTANSRLEATHKRTLEAALARTGNARGPSLAERAASEVDNNRNVEGVRLALRALEEGDDSVTAHLAGAVALERLGMYAASLEFYDQALRRAPGHPTIAALLGGCASRMGETGIAEHLSLIHI